MAMDFKHCILIPIPPKYSVSQVVSFIKGKKKIGNKLLISMASSGFLRRICNE